MPADCVYPDAVDAHDAGNTLTGRQPARGIPVRPRAYHAGYPPEALFFPQAVELRLRKIRGSLAQDIVAAAQFAVFTLQFLQTLAFCGAQSAVTCTGIALILTQLGTQGLRRTADFRGDGADGRPLRVIVILAFDNHTNGSLTDLRGKAHIFSHPVYLSLKEFSLQDSRGDSQCLHSRIANIRRDYLHKVTTTISKNHAMIVIEDLKVSNMSKSTAGTVSQPGRNVRAKSGLNRSILDQGWYEMRRQLEYKQLWRGGQVLAVPPAYTSQRCACCGHTAKENRLTQSKFVCRACGYTANADVNGARNILAAGHAVLACGGTVQSGRPLKQEPDAEQSAVTH